MIKYHPLLNIALDAARSAAQLIVHATDRIDELEVWRKGNDDLVSNIDIRAEKIIIDGIRKYYPDHAILSEESGELNEEESEYLWVIDPLDGTRNFVHALPHFAVSVACLKNGRPEHALVIDPVRQEEFTASRGQGAYVNGRRRLRVSQCDRLSRAMVATGMPSQARHGELIDEYAHCLDSVRAQVASVRHFGSAALDLAYVASGRLDGFWEARLPVWDQAAGSLLIEEAGGIVCEFNGGHDYLRSGNIVCGSPLCCKLLTQKINPLMRQLGRGANPSPSLPEAQAPGQAPSTGPIAQGDIIGGQAFGPQGAQDDKAAARTADKDA